ncbi:hypothetical protein C5E10_13570 [Pseudoclavibacter sp. RFBG4]|uniref:M56 family metallopeptidase n=1 Tax=Pseudoclavibacter sp. RFBG4 TaxID=2080575 RepID=UPI000CE7D630|nr:M56 family metallopeptidase [Pseudoclavibacter sp. RFBG4]PPG28613.1 hypothetical protein C5E10_13570 [Pseudoclavibacter sp. RFBG4]
MIVLLVTCLTGVLVVMAGAPAILSAGTWQLRSPRVALTIWFFALFLGLSVLVVPLIVTLATAVTTSPATSPQETLTLTIAAWLGLGGVGAALAFIGMAAEPLVFSQRDQVSSIAFVAREREKREGFTLVRFESDEAIAMAVPGRQPEIFLSSACEELLSAPQLQAVLAHELAHLRQLHGWAVRIAEINATLVGWLPAGRRLQQATLLLVELAADDTAARQAGPAHLANALAILSDATGDPSLELRALRLTTKRWPGKGRRRLPPSVRLVT